MIEKKSLSLFKIELQKKLKLRSIELQREISRNRIHAFFNFIKNLNIPFSFIAFLLLLPLFFISLLLFDIATNYNLFYSIIGLNLDYVVLSKFDNFSKTIGAIYHFEILLAASYLPAYLYLSKMDNISTKIKKFYERFLIMTFGGPIGFLALLVAAVVLLVVLIIPILILMLFGVNFDNIDTDSFFFHIWYIYLIICGAYLLYGNYILLQAVFDSNKNKNKRYFPFILALFYYILILKHLFHLF